MPVVVIGGNGQLGSDLCRQFQPRLGELVTLNRSDFDLRDHDRVRRTLEDIHPSVIVNTAAFHKLEACESDPEQAFAVNCIAVRNLALVAEMLGARLVHLSTDYVFDGKTNEPYREDSPPGPINVYGTSKAAGELFVRSLCPLHLIVRTSGLYGLAGSSGKGGNFVQTMLRLGRERGAVSVVSDQVLSPTYTLDLAEMIWQLVESNAQGLVHVTSTGSCSWYEFARSIFDFSNVKATVEPINTALTASPVRRPPYSVLANRQLEALGLGPMRPWKAALASYLAASVTGSNKIATSGVTAHEGN